MRVWEGWGRGGGAVCPSTRISSVSLQFLDRLGRRWDMTDDSAEIRFSAFSAGGRCEQFWHGQGCPLFHVVHPALLLPTTASPTLQGAVKNVLERLSWRVTCPNHANFRLLTVATGGSCGLARKLTMLRNQS